MQSLVMEILAKAAKKTKAQPPEPSGKGKGGSAKGKESSKGSGSRVQVPKGVKITHEGKTYDGRHKVEDHIWNSWSQTPEGQEYHSKATRMYEDPAGPAPYTPETYPTNEQGYYESRSGQPEPYGMPKGQSRFISRPDLLDAATQKRRQVAQQMPMLHQDHFDKHHAALKERSGDYGVSAQALHQDHIARLDHFIDHLHKAKDAAFTLLAASQGDPISEQKLAEHYSSVRDRLNQAFSHLKDPTPIPQMIQGAIASTKGSRSVTSSKPPKDHYSTVQHEDGSWGVQNAKGQKVAKYRFDNESMARTAAQGLSAKINVKGKGTGSGLFKAGEDPVYREDPLYGNQASWWNDKEEDENLKSRPLDTSDGKTRAGTVSPQSFYEESPIEGGQDDLGSGDSDSTGGYEVMDLGDGSYGILDSQTGECLDPSQHTYDSYEQALQAAQQLAGSPMKKSLYSFGGSFYQMVAQGNTIKLVLTPHVR